jgi:hypothetical protein
MHYNGLVDAYLAIMDSALKGPTLEWSVAEFSFSGEDKTRSSSSSETLNEVRAEAGDSGK